MLTRDSYADRLRSACPTQKSVERLASRLGVHWTTIYGWARTGSMPKNPKTRAAFAKAIGVKS